MADKELQKEKESPLRKASAWREAGRLMYDYRGRLAVGLFLMIVNRLAGLVLPASSKFLIDDVIGAGKTDLLVPLALAVGAATVVQSITTFSLSQVISIAAQRAIMEMRCRVQRHVDRLPIPFFDDHKSGELIARIMTDAEGIRNLVGTGVIQLVGGLFTAVFALAVLFYLNWQLTLVTLTILVTFGGGMAFAFTRLRPIFRKRREVNADVTGRLGETLGGIRVVKAYGLEEREESVFRKGVDKLFALIARSITGVSAITAFGTLVIGVVGVLMIIFGGRAIIAGTMTLGDFVMYIFFTGLMAAPIIQIASIGTQVSEALAGLDRIRDLLDRDTEEDADEGRDAIAAIRGDIAFENVSFAYTPGVDVLRNVSFAAPAGTTTALVGSSGSGKSTLVALVMGFISPREGSITVDGVDLASIRVHDYRRHLGVVLQENFLFDGSVRDNIAFARPEASDDEVFEASKLANCHHFISAFPDGYETIVGERGVKLSGGQRQRVAIARALLADPRILILDEATSNLDSESEALIQEGLRRLRSGRTTFVIAHRLSTIRSADRILVIEDGEIVESGTHEELLLRDGRYRELYDRQHARTMDLFVNPGEDVGTPAG